MMTLSDASIGFPPAPPPIDLIQQYVKRLRSYAMTTAAIEYIWKAILESERSDEFQLMDVVARWTPPTRSDALTLGRESITAAVTKALRVTTDSLPTVTLPPLR